MENMTSGYEDYGRHLSVNSSLEYGEASSDDLSSEWEGEDLTEGEEGEETPRKPSQWRKVKGVVQWTPFVQTYKNQKYRWVQLAGHAGNFRAGRDGTIQKRLCGREQTCLKELMADPLRPFVPEYRGETVTEEGEHFLQLQDLLGEFVEPCVMDCKIGVRTYLEDELAKARENPKLRKDMYEKMVAIDRSAPTEEEHRLKAVTKPRYMVWRETISSTAILGFRIEGIRKSAGFSSKDFKTTRSKEQIKEAVNMFTEGYPKAVPQYLERLKEIQSALDNSQFFRHHELIGSSLLFVHDVNKASVWMIDFAKTTPLPAGVQIDHRSPWVPGNHEDGYRVGTANLATLLSEL